MSNCARYISWLCAVSILALLPALGEDALDRFAAENRRLEQNDPSIPVRDIPPEYGYATQYAILQSISLTDLSLDDPRLKAAWISLIRILPGQFPQEVPQESSSIESRTYADMIRRGSTMGPALFSLLQELQDTDFERAILLCIDSLKGVDLTPFIEHSRSLLRDRSKSPYVIDAAELLIRQGNADDAKLIERTAGIRPFFADSLRKCSMRLQTRLDKAKGTEVSPSSTSSNAQMLPPILNSTPSPGASVARPAITGNEEPTSSTPWALVIVMIAAAMGLLWLVLKRRTK
jgi:hypothetical protein